MRYLFIILVCTGIFLSLILSTPVFAQRQNGKRFFLRNPFIVNPANAGYFKEFNLYCSTDQPGGSLKAGNARYLIAAQYALKKSRLGVGGKMDYFKRGIFETLDIDANFAYKISLSKDLLLSAGTNIGLINNNYSSARLSDGVDKSDPTLYSDYYSKSNLKIGAGASLISYNFESGLSFPRFFVSGESVNLQSTLYAAYSIEMGGRDFMIKPAFYGNYYFGKLFNYEISTNIIFQETFWVQLGYGKHNWMNAGIGFYYNQVEIGYSFDAALLADRNYLGNYHSVMLSFYLKGKRELEFLRPLSFRKYK